MPHGCGKYVGVLGYADDQFLISPMINGLQDILKVCDRYAQEHLKLSTNINPAKSKTKCMTFLCIVQHLRKLHLCGNELPWIGKGKHLDISLTNKLGKILCSDIWRNKRATYKSTTSLC